MSAATEIWAEAGWAAVTMRGVCAKAGLIDRYFYESFADRDALLVAIWDRVRDDLTAALAAAIGANPGDPPLVVLRQGIAAVVFGFAVDRSRAQILFGDHSGSPDLENRRHRLLLDVTNVMAEIGAQYVKPGTDRTEFQQSVLMGVGGFLELVAAWHAGVIDADAAEIVDQVSHFGEILGSYYLPSD